MGEQVVVKNLSIKDTIPDYNNPIIKEHLHMINTNWKLYDVSLELHKINKVYVNSLRQILCDGIPTKTLSADLNIDLNMKSDNLDTDDKFILPEVVETQLKLVPLNQGIPLDATLEIYANNKNGREIMNVGHEHFKYINKGTNNIIGDNFINNLGTPLLQLNPGRYLRVRNIRIKQFPGYINKNVGHHVLTAHCIQYPLDKKYLDGTIKLAQSDPREHILSFRTKGTMEPKKIITLACDCIIERLTKQTKNLDKLAKNGNEFAFRMEGETQPVANSIERSLIEQFNIDCIAICDEGEPPFATLTFKTSDENPDQSLLGAINHSIMIFETIKRQIK